MKINSIVLKSFSETMSKYAAQQQMPIIFRYTFSDVFALAEKLREMANQPARYARRTLY